MMLNVQIAMFVLKPWHRAVGVAAFAGVAISVLAWIAWSDPAINFLSRDKRAEWIVFPAAVDAHAHWFASLDATFRREFDLTDRPPRALLSVRAMRRAEVKINGTPIHFRPNSNWKKIVTAGVAEQLHAGTNVIEARVFNYNGPPALWLALTTDQLSLRTDQSWETSFAGSSWRHAALASWAKTPGPGSSVASGEGMFDAVKKFWIFSIILIATASVVTFLWNVSFKQSIARWRGQILLLVLAGLWLLLFWNNGRLLPFHEGFDAKEHLNYISYIQQHRSLPLPTEGWEMYQPPLYYLIAAASLSASALSVDNPMSIYVLRWLGAFFGIANFVLVFLSFAAPASEASRLHRTFAGGVSADAFVSRALCDERIIVGYAVYSGALSLSPSFEKRNAGHVAIYLGRIGAWRGNTGKSDRYFAAANRNCCDHRQARLRASANRNVVAQPWITARDLFGYVRLALRTYLAEVRHPAPWQLGCD